MIFVPIIVVVIFTIAFTPTSTKGRRHSGYRRKSKGFFGSLMSDKRGGVMCGPGGVSTRGKRR